MMQTVTQPGPASLDRLALVKASGRPVELTLNADIPLETAVANALKDVGCDNSAYLEIKNAAVADLAYVMPAHSDDAAHAAWYSHMHRFNGAGKINHLGMIVGHRENRCFIHGHGSWTPHDGPMAMGHILSPITVLAKPTVAIGYALSGARFEGHDDPETNFTLFSPTAHGAQDASDTNFAVLRILPNQDFDTALDDACARLGWTSARAWGVGSINKPHFVDDRVLDSLPTELVVLDALCRADGKGVDGADIRVVGIGADQIEQGRLKRGYNSVLITAEIVLKRET